jgi:tripartite-type tricarboxylate transporter receptor subunit TctC
MTDVRQIVFALAAAGVLLAPGIAPAAQPDDSTNYPTKYPTKPIRLIVAQTAGGNSDMVARAYALRLSERLGQQIVVDNRGGGSGIIATELVVNAQPDGYTLLLAPTAHAINPSLMAKLPYDTLRDVKAVSLLGVGYNILVVAQNHAARSVRDIIAAAKAQPGKLTYASSGTAGATHLTGELFRVMAGINILHVPYKGAPASLTALVGGETDFSFSSMASTLPLVRGGRLRALGVSSPERWPTLPEVPTVAEAGVPGYESSSWQGLFGPARLAPEIVNLLHREVAEIAKSADMHKRLSAEGLLPRGTSPKAFESFIADEIAKWSKVTRAAGISVK